MSTIFVKSTCFRRLLAYLASTKVLRTVAILKIWHRRGLAMTSIFAWLGDITNMWFMICWRSWKGLALRRLQWTTFIAKHILTRVPFSKWLLFKGWMKVYKIECKERALGSQKYEEENASVVWIRAAKCISIPPWRPPVSEEDVMEASGLHKVSEMEIFQLIDDLMCGPFPDGGDFVVPTDWRHSPSNQALKLL